MSETNNPALNELIAALRASDLDFANPPLETREAFEATLAQIPVADDVSFVKTQLGNVPTLAASIPGTAADSALLYLHGGAFTAGSARGYSGLATELARAGGISAYAIDYRLAPEHPFPAAVEDAAAAYRGLIDQGISPSRIVIAGDSAGGGLAISTLVMLRDSGAPLPAAAFVISPWLDLKCAAASYESKAADDPSLTVGGLRASAARYLGTADAEHPLASPLYADLSGLPPLLIHVGSSEILLDDSVRLAGTAGSANVQVELEIWPNMIHVWHAFGFMIKEGHEAVARAGHFMQSILSGSR